MGTTRIEERFAFTGGKVHRDGPTPFVEGVLICGPVSANRRRYKPEAFAGDRFKRYEGRPVYVNHSGKRLAEDKLGWFSDVTLRENGMPQGRLNLNPKHALAESVLWAAENKPDFYGMSHVADCHTSRGADGVEEVGEVVGVESIDLVADPATTKGFYESTGGRPVKTVKFAKLIEWLAPKVSVAQLLRVKRLSEIDGVGDADIPMPEPETPDAEADPDDAMAAGFRAAISACVDAYLSGDMDFDEALDKIEKLFDAFDDGGGEETDDATPPQMEAVGDGSSNQAAQQRAMNAKDPKASDKDGEHVGYSRRSVNRRKRRGRKEDVQAAAGDAVQEALGVFRKVGFRGFDADDVAIVAGAPAEKREAVAKKLMLAATPAKPPEKPVSQAKTPVVTAAESKVPETGKSFAESIRG